MSYYAKTKTCTRCGFKDSNIVKVYGDFYGWEPRELHMAPSDCPFCKHAKKLGIVIKDKTP